jgi:hypothetical protein
VADIRLKSFAVALLVHGCIFFLFTFTFSAPVITSKPVFVFLGSFLRQQDIVLPSVVRAEAHANLDIRAITLDSQGASGPGKVGKPSLVEKASPQKKSQFKPVVAEPIHPSDNGTKDDLGIEFEPVPPVKMEINAE